MSWKLRRSNPGGGRDFPHLSSPALRPVFPGGKVLRDADPSPPSSAEVKNRVELELRHPRCVCANKVGRKIVKTQLVKVILN
jgi:hypothetical protein